jgi:hypothetical protein
MYVVEHDGHAMAGGLGQADIARNDGFEYLRTEEAAEIGGDLLGERGAVVIHGEKDAFDGELGVDSATKAHERIKKFGYALESQVFALDRHQDGIAGG